MTETSCAERKGLCELEELVRQAITSMQGNVSFSPGLMITLISNQFGAYRREIFVCSFLYLVTGFFGS